MSSKAKKKASRSASPPKKEKAKQSRKSSPTPANNGVQYNYRLYSARRKRFLGKPVDKTHGQAVFKLAKPHFPRMDGCDFADIRHGEKLYLKRFAGEEEDKILSVKDLSLFNLFENVEWDVDDDARNDVADHWAHPDDDDDYVDAGSSLPAFIARLQSDEGIFESEAWRCLLCVDRQKSQVYIKSVTVTFPKQY